MFTNESAGRVGELMVETPGAINVIDVNSADYQEALNRLAGEGWEVVTVNKSNYWLFRRPRGSAADGRSPESSG